MGLCYYYELFMTAYVYSICKDERLHILWTELINTFYLSLGAIVTVTLHMDTVKPAVNYILRYAPVDELLSREGNAITYDYGSKNTQGVGSGLLETWPKTYRRVWARKLPPFFAKVAHS